MVGSDQNSENPGLWPDGDGPVRLVPEEAADDKLIIDVAGFEGPLDLLLQLARNQKVDISKISILALAEQYLDFIHAARRMKLELAADYLVMAAWLAYLKSRLLIPQTPESDETPAEELAARLAYRLQRLQVMREAGAQLMARDQLGRDVFERGAPEPLIVETKQEYADNIVDLLKAYAERRQKAATHEHYEVRRLPIWSVKEARAALERMIGVMDDWGRFDTWLSEYLVEPERRPSVIASSFTASLELAREGVVEMRQQEAFEPIYMRRRQATNG
ncbi:MAG: segregation and condensation protein A [Aestuariivirgaceae bacterium]